MNIPQVKCDATGMSIEQLCDLLDVQQRAIRFLTSQYEQLLGMKNVTFGPIKSFAVGDVIPAGWWQCVTPDDSSAVATAQIGSPPQEVSLFAPVFWSDGLSTTTATVALTAAQIAVPKC